MRNSILCLTQRHRVRVFVTQHLKPIKQAKMFLGITLHGNFKRNHGSRRRGHGVNSRHASNAHGEKFVIGQHFNCGFSRGFVRKSFGHIRVHGLQRRGHEFRNNLVDTWLHANTKVRRINLLPLGKFIHQPQTK